MVNSLFLSSPYNQSFVVERWDNKSVEHYNVNLKDILKHANYIFPVYSNSRTINVINTIRKERIQLAKYAEVIWGVKVYELGKGTPPQKGNESELKVFHSNKKIKETHRPLLGGGEIFRYELNWKGGFINYGKWLAAPRKPEWFDGPRIVVREVTAKGIIQATIVKDDFVFSNSVDGIRLISKEIRLEFILGLVNSKLISFYHSNTSANAFKGTFPKVLLVDLRDLPIPAITRNNKSLHDEIVLTVESILQLQKEKQQTTLPDKLEQLKARIQYTDDKINKLVYKLYGLSEEEIGIVEM